MNTLIRTVCLTLLAFLPVEQALGLTGLSQCDRCEAAKSSLLAEPDPDLEAKAP